MIKTILIKVVVKLIKLIKVVVKLIYVIKYI